MMKSLLLMIFALTVFAGCGAGGESYEYAPVSGKVTFDGEPLENATVTFQPLGTAANPGPNSYGKTDAQGNYTLKPVNVPNHQGAVVGKHRVLITRNLEEDPNDDAGSTGPAKAQLPAEYNRKSKLEFDVPPAGSDAANFDLES